MAGLPTPKHELTIRADRARSHDGDADTTLGAPVADLLADLEGQS